MSRQFSQKKNKNKSGQYPQICHSTHMQHRIAAKEDTNGYISIHLNGRTLAYGLDKDQASFYYRGIMTGIEEAGQKVILDDSIFDIFH